MEIVGCVLASCAPVSERSRHKSVGSSSSYSPVSHVHFDPLHDVCWTLVADHSQPIAPAARVTGFVCRSGSMDVVARYKAHASAGGRLLVDEHAVFSVGGDAVHCATRGGITRFHASSPAIAAAHVVAKGVAKDELLVGGRQRSIVTVACDSGKVLRTADTEAGLTVLRRSRLVCCGAQNGAVMLKDPRSLRTEHTLFPHNGFVSDLDVIGNTLVTCGYSMKHNQYTPDSSVLMYDLRTMKPLPNIAFTPAPETVALADQAVTDSPLFLRFHPQHANLLVAVGMLGTVHFFDMANSSSSSSFYVPTYGGSLSAFDMSSSGEMMAFSDPMGYLYLYGAQRPEDSTVPEHEYVARVNHFSSPVEIESPLVETHQTIDDNTPLNTIGMPYYSNQLLSSKFPASSLYPSPPPSTYRGRNLMASPGRSKYPSAQTNATPIDTFLPLLDPDFLASLKYTDSSKTVGYASNPFLGIRKRNQSSKYPTQVSDGTRTHSGDVLLFRSEIDRKRQPRGNSSERELDDAGERKRSALGMPSYYRKMEIQYSRFGVEDFDFAYFNHTKYAGLETHIANSYCNSLLQVLFFTKPFRALAKHHMVSDCDKEFCIACELGFLFRMLEDARGSNCQASNFLRAFATIPQASALGLFEPEKPKPDTPYAQLVQNLHRFLLEQVHQEFATLHEFEPVKEIIKRDFNDGYGKLVTFIQQLFGLRVKSVSKCQCLKETVRWSVPFSVDIAVPKTPVMSPSKQKQKVTGSPSKSHGVPNATYHTFSDLLQHSLAHHVSTKAWCSKCQAFTPTTQSKSIQSLPVVLEINCSTLGAKSLQATDDDVDSLAPWRFRDHYFRFGDGDETEKERSPSVGPTPRFFLPQTIEVVLEGQDGAATVQVREEFDEEDEKDEKSVSSTTTKRRKVVYDLSAIVCQVENGVDPAHLISFVKVTNDLEARWHLFNDFLVKPVSVAEALQFKSRWKIPAIIQYIRRDVQNVLDISPLVTKFDRKLLTDITEEEMFIIRRRRRTEFFSAHPDVEPLSPEDLSTSERLLIAIDAEFVAEETEIRSDGTRSLIRPKRMSLARVSVVRGDGQFEGTPFIDDYISTSEPIVDYLTEYSGIQPDDLDPKKSAHHVIPLKAAYKKLRVLVDMGCIFVGHGLKKDFRTINLLVPPDQIIDTVDLFRLEGQRMISLRFLAWYVLKEDIQSDSHDSVVDARTALALYKKYLKIKAQGNIEDYLEKLYDDGRRYNWKAPHWNRDNESKQYPGMIETLNPANFPAIGAARTTAPVNHTGMTYASVSQVPSLSDRILARAQVEFDGMGNLIQSPPPYPSHPQQYGIQSPQQPPFPGYAPPQQQFGYHQPYPRPPPSY